MSNAFYKINIQTKKIAKTKLKTPMQWRWQFYFIYNDTWANKMSLKILVFLLPYSHIIRVIFKTKYQNYLEYYSLAYFTAAIKICLTVSEKYRKFRPKTISAGLVGNIIISGDNNPISITPLDLRTHENSSCTIYVWKITKINHDDE